MSGSPIDNQGGRPPLNRDSQQWVLDYLIQQTGRAYHFQGEGRGDLPASVKSHAMISKTLGQQALGLEQFADRERAAGHGQTALGLYFKAAGTYAKAQHPVFELNDEKRFLYAGLRRSYGAVIDLAPYPIEHLQIPFDGAEVAGLLHIDPTATDPAPLVFYVPGCDAVKEAYPHPQFNFAHQRGMHIFSFDGPGAAECNLRGIRLTSDNYERAASAALDVLLQRPEIDAERVVVYSNSFGSYWGLRFAATDHRIKAVAATQASICAKYIQMDLESPRWKQLMAFLTQAEDEAQLDAVMAEMTLEGYMDKIACPVLLTAGEYDPRAPLDEVYQRFDELEVPGELWVMANQHHLLSLAGGGASWSRGQHGIVVDWLADRLAGQPLAHPGEVLWVDAKAGPYSPRTTSKRQWFDGVRTS